MAQNTNESYIPVRNVDMTGPHRGGRLVPWIVLLALLFTTEAGAIALAADTLKAHMGSADHGTDGLSQAAGAPSLASNNGLRLAQLLPVVSLRQVHQMRQV